MTDKPVVRFRHVDADMMAPGEVTRYQVLVVDPDRPTWICGLVTSHRGGRHKSGVYWLATCANGGPLRYDSPPRTRQVFHRRSRAGDALVLHWMEHHRTTDQAEEATHAH